jgi:hypothetical protein
MNLESGSRVSLFAKRSAGQAARPTDQRPCLTRQVMRSTFSLEQAICPTHDFSLTLDSQNLVSKLSIESEHRHATAEKLLVMATKLTQR